MVSCSCISLMLYELHIEILKRSRSVLDNSGPTVRCSAPPYYQPLTSGDTWSFAGNFAESCVQTKFEPCGNGGRDSRGNSSKCRKELQLWSLEPAEVNLPAVSRLGLYRFEHDRIWVCERGRARSLIKCGSWRSPPTRIGLSTDSLTTIFRFDVDVSERKMKSQIMFFWVNLSYHYKNKFLASWTMMGRFKIP